MSLVEGIKSVPSVCEQSHRRTHTVGIDFIPLTSDNGGNKKRLCKIKYIVACQGLQGLQRTTTWAHTPGGGATPHVNRQGGQDLLPRLPLKNTRNLRQCRCKITLKERYYYLLIFAHQSMAIRTDNICGDHGRLAPYNVVWRVQI